MTFSKTEVHILQKKANISSLARTGVSMHCHTENSREMLDFVPHYAEKLPVISHFWKKESAKFESKNGRPIDLSTSYWSPPLTARAVFESEKSQIEESGLDAIVSVTDHDSIAGQSDLRTTAEIGVAPISLEWTVPYDFGFFHLGVHGLPENHAEEITQILLDYTFNVEGPDSERLTQILAMLNEFPAVLIVFNHPIWDIELVGQERHSQLLDDFLRTHGHWIHALEINGFRAWSENKAVLELAETHRLPVVSGGDRHGCQPNTIVNVTNAVSFDEFTEEIRVDKHSEVVVMPEYQLPLHSRQLQSFSEILDTYPEFPAERIRWFDRVFFDMNDGRGVLPLSSHGWKYGGPIWLRAAIWTLGFLGSPVMRPAFQRFVKNHDKVQRDIEQAVSIRPNLGISPKLSSRVV